MKNIFIKKGVGLGKTVAIFSGVHGNENAGVLAMNKVLDEINLVKGKVYFVYANPEAIKKNIRYVEKNLNRCFIKGNNGRMLEDKRALELMNILDECEALLDLHASNTIESIPFIICESNGYEIASKMDFGIISSGWDKFEPGATDGYMFNSGKIGICLECGSVNESDKNVELAEKSIYQFLRYLGLILDDVKYSNREQKFIDVIKVVRKRTNNFLFSRDFKDFEELKDGELIAIDGNEKYFSDKNEYILFPNSNKKIGEEVFLIGKIRI